MVVEDIFAFVFGEEWRIAGYYAQILSILYFCRFIVSPLTITPMVLKRVNIDFYFQTIMLLLIVVVLSIGFFIKLCIEDFLYCFSIAYGLYYLIYLMYLKQMVSK